MDNLEVLHMRASARKRVAVIAACIGICMASGIGIMSAQSFAAKPTESSSAADDVSAYIPSTGHAVTTEDGTVVDSVDDIPERYQTVANYVYDQLAYGLQPDATTAAPPSGVTHDTHDDGDGCTIDVIRYSTVTDDAFNNASGNDDGTSSEDAGDNTSDLGVESKTAEDPDDGSGNVTWSIVRRKSDSRIVAVMAGNCSEQD